jgi:hypothetical protein
MPLNPAEGPALLSPVASPLPHRIWCHVSVVVVRWTVSKRLR